MVIICSKTMHSQMRKKSWVEHRDHSAFSFGISIIFVFEKVQGQAVVQFHSKMAGGRRRTTLPFILPTVSLGCVRLSGVASPQAALLLDVLTLTLPTINTPGKESKIHVRVWEEVMHDMFYIYYMILYTYKIYVLCTWIYSDQILDIVILLGAYLQ